MAVQIQQLLKKFPELLALQRGEPEQIIHNLKVPSVADADSLVFVSNTELLKEAQSTEAQAWVVSRAIESMVPGDVKTVLLSTNVVLAMALIGKEFFPQARHHQSFEPKISDRATIAPSAKISGNCIIGPGVVIGSGVEIAEDCVIGANSILESGVRIGARTHIHSLVFIGHDCLVGADCIVKPNTTIGGDGYGYAQDAGFNHHRINHYGRVVLEDRVHIGAGVQMDRGTFLDSHIGAGTKIDNHCHFGHNIVVGQNTLITAGMITAGSVTIGNRCVFGGRTTIKGHLSICDGVQIAGNSGITKSITKAGEYGGFPLQELNKEMRLRAHLKSLPKMAKQLQRILKHLKLNDESN